MRDMVLKLSRPLPALPDSYFWTWDHSTNWVLDDPGIYNSGFSNRYLKKPETYIEDYRRLAALCSDIGIKGIVIWGFLRDSHGGIEYAKNVASYGASKGIAIMPGVGTTWYGGPYYEGSHRYNIEKFLSENPSANIKAGENFVHHGACPSDPLFREWISEGISWLFKEFDIGGINLENGDFMTCGCAACKRHMSGRPKDEPAFYTHQYLGYNDALRSASSSSQKPDNRLITWATYTGFIPGGPDNECDKTAYLHCRKPSIFDKLDTPEVTQWTLTGMLLENPLPLDSYLDNGAPREALGHPKWPDGLKPPSIRGTGLMHQGSQWTENRYDQVVSSIKEACLRAYRSGLTGISMHGEVSAGHIPSALNYLAFSHFSHWPEDTVRDFGRNTLGELFSSEAEGEKYAEVFSHLDSGTLTSDDFSQADSTWKDIEKHTSRGSGLDRESNLNRLRFWYWLKAMLSRHDKNEKAYIFRKPQDRHTVSFF